MVLVIGGQEFPCHKAILAARSPVFETMFEAEFKEKIEGKVEITDLDSDAGACLLRYMYTEDASNLGEHALNLLGAAEKVFSMLWIL